MSEEVVIIEDLPTASGHTLKRVVLNAPKALNALSIEMIQRLQPELESWEADDSVVCVVIEGAGEKAFCAGGDIVQIYRHMTEGADYQGADDYFRQEYCLDYTLHTLKIPVITWIDGIAMGGGLGISVAGALRVVTENARLAMPEITIGLYPDVGSTWFLSRMPGRTGLFLGLTGAQMNAGDALFTGLADRFLPAASRSDVLDKLTGARDWSAPLQTVGAVLREVASQSTEACPESQVRKYFDLINECVDADTLAEIVAAIGGLHAADDKWLAKAAKTLDAGCPVTAHLIYQQTLRGRTLSLAESFQLELAITCQCVRHPDFREGVRALLIDKDGQPDWRYDRVADVPAAYVEEHFTAPWSGRHPMADFFNARQPPLFN
jgi:enoyl-CoA hydratase/carnithine racemase